MISINRQRTWYGAALLMLFLAVTSFHAGCTQDGGVAVNAGNEPSLAGGDAAGTESGTAPSEAGEPHTTFMLVQVDGTERAFDSKPLPLMLSVKASFGVPMDTASVESALSFTDPNGNGVDVTRSWNAEETAITLKPVKALEPGSTYTVELTPDALSKEGRAAQADAQAFTTRQRMTINSDLNGDGVGDFAVGAPGQNDSGSVYVYSGKDPSTPMAVINFPFYNKEVRFGASVAIVNDLNGDGKAELLIGAPGLDTTPGGTLIKDTGGAFLISGAKLTGNVPLTSVDVAIYGSDKLGLGQAVADAGDIDGDGMHDIMIGSNPLLAPKVFFFSGANLIDSDPNTPTLLFETDATASIAGDPGSFFGYTLAGIGDLDLDGKDDVLIGAPSNGTGHAYIFSGASIAPDMNLGDMFASLAGAADDQAFGFIVASAGDFLADGYLDVVVGDWNKDSAAGAVYVFAGKDLSAGGLFGIDRAARTIRGAAPDTRLGSSIANLGDMNLDGIDDIVVGSIEDPMPNITPMGALQLYAGPDAAPLGPELVPMNIAHYGLALAPVGDIDGQGKPDFLMGDPYYGLLKGGVFLFTGEDMQAFKLLVPAGLTDKAFFGMSLAGTQAGRAPLPF